MLDKCSVKIKNNEKNKGRLFVWTMLAIPIINWLIFWFIVNSTSFIMAFKDQLGKFSFVNFELVFESITSSDGELLKAFINTLKYFFVSEFILFPLTIIICYFIYKKILGYRFFRIVFFLPGIISAVVFAGVFKVFVSNQGPLGVTLSNLGVNFPETGLLYDEKTATNTILVYVVWTGVHTNMLLISGAMARIPTEILESASLDGVTMGQELVDMIIPLISPTLTTLVILGMSQLLLGSGPILLLQPNVREYNTNTISYWIFDKVYFGGESGYGEVSAAGMVFTAVLFPIILFTKWLVDKIPAVEY